MTAPLFPDERIDRINEHLTVIQKKNGLTFGTDAYLLSAFAAGDKTAVAVDLGSGTGVIPLLLLARNKAKTVHAVEIQPEFADLISRNASINGFETRLIPHLCDIRDADALRKIIPPGSADIVLSNPPYCPRGRGIVSRDDPKRIARHEENGDIGDFCRAAATLLRFGGKFFTVFPASRLVDLIVSLRSAGLEPKRMTLVYPRPDASPTLVLTEARLGGGAELKLTPPLYLHQADGMESAWAKHIYDTCSFDFPQGQMGQTQTGGAD